MKIETTPEVQLEVRKVDVKYINKVKESYNNGFNCWHSHNKYSYKISERTTIEVAISDSVGGCGMQQIYGWLPSSAQRYPEVKYCLIYLLQNLHYGVGLVICQVGQDFFGSEIVKALEELGFTYDEYENYQHGAEYYQRLYKLIIPKEVGDEFDEDED